MNKPATSSQTVGPFFGIGLTDLQSDHLTAQGTTGELVTVQGRLLDGDGDAIPDGLIEVWQADQFGRYAGAEDLEKEGGKGGWRGFGRVATDERGAFEFTTIKPGRVAGPGGALQAPHIVITVFMRGLLRHLITRMYFPGETSNEVDGVLACVAAERRPTLIAKSSPEGLAKLHWDIYMQGEKETAFFDL
jgi:protocatechuate 3,4-dioxygenase, alpha subunit